MKPNTLIYAADSWVG